MAQPLSHQDSVARFLCALMVLVFVFSMTGMSFAAEPPEGLPEPLTTVYVPTPLPTAEPPVAKAPAPKAAPTKPAARATARVTSKRYVRTAQTEPRLPTHKVLPALVPTSTGIIANTNPLPSLVSSLSREPTPSTNRSEWDTSASGYVISDDDGDGLWGEGEGVLVGWTIYLYRRPLPAPVVDSVTASETPEGYALYATAVTDANGYYEFHGLLPGAYAVTEKVRTGWNATLVPDAGFSIEENRTHVTWLMFGNQQVEFSPPTGGDFGSIPIFAGLAGLMGLGLRRLGRGAA